MYTYSYSFCIVFVSCRPKTDDRKTRQLSTRVRVRFDTTVSSLMANFFVKNSKTTRIDSCYLVGSYLHYRSCNIHIAAYKHNLVYFSSCPFSLLGGMATNVNLIFLSIRLSTSKTNYTLLVAAYSEEKLGIWLLKISSKNYFILGRGYGRRRR